MKTVNKTNFYGTASLSLSDKDNAQIFQTPNHAIHWLNSTGLVADYYPIFDDGLFIAAYKSHEFFNKETECREYTLYKIFNFGSRAAIYVQDFEDANCVSQKFMTKECSDHVHPED